MLSFELSAIDIILTISVVVLLILYITKRTTINQKEKPSQQSTSSTVSSERPAQMPHRDHTECPRGFGNIRKLGEDNSVSERCLGCYRIMECYSESE